MRLTVIPISHYCERARWALEWAGLDFEEDFHLQGFHARAVKRAGGRRTAPVLVTRDGKVLPDSSDIVQYAHENGTRPLYPDAQALRSEIEEFEAELAGPFGVETRRLIYFHLVGHRKLLLRYNNFGAPLYQRIGLRLTYPFAVKRLCRYLKVDAEHVARGRKLIDKTLKRIGERLSDGRRYLFGDAFTAADLTFASLAAPLVGPPEYGIPLPTPDELPSDTRALLDEFRATDAGQFALRVYRENRR